MTIGFDERGHQLIGVEFDEFKTRVVASMLYGIHPTFDVRNQLIKCELVSTRAVVGCCQEQIDQLIGNMALNSLLL